MIQLIAIAKSTDVVSYGIEEILKPFMMDVAKLESVNSHMPCTCIYIEKIMFLYITQDEGVEFVIDGHTQNFRGSLALVAADNLTSQFIGGYKALNSALRKCRHCMAVSHNMCTKVYIIL